MNFVCGSRQLLEPDLRLRSLVADLADRARRLDRARVALRDQIVNGRLAAVALYYS